MYQPDELENLMFLDIETARGLPDYDAASPILQKWWSKRAARQYAGLEPADAYREYAGIFAEFGRVVCISCGILRRDAETGRWTARLRSFYEGAEPQLLQAFGDVITPWFAAQKRPERRFCGHNIKEFDLPYLGRRFLINGLVPLPAPLQLYNLKPWQVAHIDTMEYWRFGDIKSYTSLELILETIGLPSPKEGFDGARVGEAYWRDDDRLNIARYCERDVVAVMRLLLHFSAQGGLDEADAGYSLPE